jgi:hypothetical protein
MWRRLHQVDNNIARLLYHTGKCSTTYYLTGGESIRHACWLSGTLTDASSMMNTRGSCAVTTNSCPPCTPSFPYRWAVGSSNFGNFWPHRHKCQLRAYKVSREIIVDWAPVSSTSIHTSTWSRPPTASACSPEAVTVLFTSLLCFVHGPD